VISQFWRGTLASLLVLVLSCSGVSGQGKAAAKRAAPDPAPVKSFGSKSAPITMEVFSDFQCPACRVLFLDTIRPVMQNYVSAGKVYLVHRDMPLPVHPYSRQAARYANAAAKLGKLEQVAEALYARQDLWSANGNVDAVVALVLTPAEMVKVRQYVRSGQLDAGIDKDVALANSHLVRSTPTIILTHKGQVFPIVGVVSYPILRQFLEEQLRK